MEVSDLRRRLRAAIDEARRRSTERRARADEASRAWARVLPETVVPTFHTLASALVAEGHRFKVQTPGETVRLALERSGDEFVELSLDTQREEPALLLRSTRGRGRRIVTAERVVREGQEIGTLTQDDLIPVLLEELIPFIER